MARLEHHEPHFETESLNTLAHHNGALTPRNLETFLSGLIGTTLRPAIQAFAPAMARTPAQMLQSAEFSIFLKYLCSLRIQSDEHLNRYFTNVFNDNFGRGNAPELLRRRPTHPLYPVYFGMREEIADTGTNGRDLAEQAANLFARFVVMATQNQPAPTNTGAGEILKQDFRAVLRQFPFAQKLAASHHLDEHTVEHELGNAKPEDLVTFIAYLRTEITTERARGSGGIKFGQVPVVQDFLSHVEVILARKIAEKLMEGEDSEANWSKIPQATRTMLLHPLAENLRHGRSWMIEHLKHVHIEHRAAPEGEGRGGPVGVAEAVHATHDVAILAHTLSSAAKTLRRWLGKAKKTADAATPPGGGHAPHH